MTIYLILSELYANISNFEKENGSDVNKTKKQAQSLLLVCRIRMIILRRFLQFLWHISQR